MCLFLKYVQGTHAELRFRLTMQTSIVEIEVPFTPFSRHEEEFLLYRYFLLVFSYFMSIFVALNCPFVPSFYSSSVVWLPSKRLKDTEMLSVECPIYVLFYRYERTFNLCKVCHGLPPSSSKAGTFLTSVSSIFAFSTGSGFFFGSSVFFVAATLFFSVFSTVFFSGAGGAAIGGGMFSPSLTFFDFFDFAFFSSFCGFSTFST